MVNWKLTVISHLFSFLLIYVFFDHLISKLLSIHVLRLFSLTNLLLEQQLLPQAHFSYTLEPIQYELLSHFLCVLRACNDALIHYITYLASPKGEGFQPSLKETIKVFDFLMLKKRESRLSPARTHQSSPVGMSPLSIGVFQNKSRVKL